MQMSGREEVPQRRRATIPVILCALALLPAAIHFIWLVLPVMPGPRAAATVVAYLSIFLLLAFFGVVLTYLLAFPVLGIASFWLQPTARRTSRWLALVSLCGLIALFLLFRPPWTVRMSFLRQSIARAQPLIAALEQYQQDHAQPVPG
jgi:hypothetical protein